MFDLRNGYSRVDKPTTLDNQSDDDTSTFTTSFDKARTVLVLIAFAIAFATALKGILLILDTRTLLSRSTSNSSPAYRRPQGTLGWRWEDDPLYAQNVSNSTFPEIYNENRVAFHHVPPTAVARIQRSSPFEVFDTDKSQSVAEIVLTNDIASIVQFATLDPALPMCAVALFLPTQDPKLMELVEPDGHMQVWNLSLATALDPTVISYTHRPPRTDFLGEVDFGMATLAATDVFFCPYASSYLTVEVKCRNWFYCNVVLQQQLVPPFYGLRLVQWRA